MVFRVRRLERVCREFNVPLPAAALAVSFGASAGRIGHPRARRGASRSSRRMAFYRTRIPAEFWQELRSQNLIHEAAPVDRDNA